jgi:hypothetical protein
MLASDALTEISTDPRPACPRVFAAPGMLAGKVATVGSRVDRERSPTVRTEDQLDKTIG